MDIQAPNQVITRSVSQKRRKHYIKNYLPSIESSLQFIAQNSPYWNKYPILKLLKAVCKMFFINQFELIFIASVIQKTQWNLQDDVITKIGTYTYPIIYNQFCYQQQNSGKKVSQPSIGQSTLQQFKRLNLYMVLVGYSVKYFFNEKFSSRSPDILRQVSRYYNEFEFVFKKWVKGYDEVKMLCSGKALNNIYMKMNNIQQKQQLNYNIVVDVIVQLSPSYSTKNKPDHNHIDNRDQSTHKIQDQQI